MYKLCNIEFLSNVFSLGKGDNVNTGEANDSKIPYSEFIIIYVNYKTESHKSINLFLISDLI